MSDKDEFKRDLESYLAFEPSNEIECYVNTYHAKVSEVLENHAPLISKEVTLRPNTKWYTSELRTVKREKRKAERTWRRTGLSVHYQIYIDKCIQNSNLLYQSKCEFYSTKIEECGSDQRSLYKITNKLLGKKQDVGLPSCDDDHELANKFGIFFHDKVKKIRNESTSECNGEQNLASNLSVDKGFLTNFEGTTSDEVEKIIMRAPNKSCILDPIPTCFVKENISIFAPSIAGIINKSLTDSEVPKSFKQAVVNPLLKKPGLDIENFKNYRPVSNLSFLSKVLEKVVAKRLNEHLESNGLLDSLQSAYRKCHSTETALLRVHHDIATALDNNSCAVLMMLDLSAAFDLIDHDILFSRLKNTFGITESALDWISSYLNGRSQRIIINSSLSECQPLEIGVPQGSVLGPKIYCMISLPIAEICKNHGINYHIYADDAQVYLVFRPTESWINISSRLISCLNDIRNRMKSNRLKLNEDKTELIVFAPKYRSNDFSEFSISFGVDIIHQASHVKNLGVIFDKSLNFEKQCNSISRSCYIQLRNIGRVRPFLTEDEAKTLVHALVTSRLDYGNALLHNINSCLINKLQKVQNVAARIVTRTKKREHITPALIELHWLPVFFRCQYKLIVYVFKALHGSTPVYWSELTEEYRPKRNIRSQATRQLVVPRVRTKIYGERRFDKSAATLWNDLPTHLRGLDSIDAFKKVLKIFLF
ncbi:hypothetical protein FSP39_004177 [Pinctada imbricata]|uniref:Reverse transcriptase domain-containing protein n=1 Tax=Pinctada imbricata TaxID=66713 RepID=A0AA88XH88_PINIB|nr:hypothetical protein FSP39_004177 [Pinctada imbricata]